MNLYLLLADAAVSAPTSDHWYDFVVFRWQDWGLELRVGLLGLLTLIVAYGAWLWIRWQFFPQKSNWGTSEITVKYGKFLEQKIVPNHDTVRIAYQAWIEITTRKVGLEFEEDHDVIEEVYKSWYQVFGILRELTKGVPAHLLRDDDNTRRLVELLIDVLNKGLRPHLTRWQAKFRRWYEAAKTADNNLRKTPQEIQREFPEYDELVESLKTVNQDFVEFSASLRALAEGPGGDE